MGFLWKLSLDGMSDALEGKVVRSTGSWSSVRLTDGKVIECRLRGSFRLCDSRATNPIAVGDLVTIELEESGNGVITDIAPRKNYIVRKSVNLSKEIHVIAANLDQAVILATITQPRTSLGFIDRFLAVAEAYNIPASVIFNKTDLLETDKLKNQLTEYSGIYKQVGYPVFHTSAITGDGIDEVKELFQNKTTLVFGHSGVGKSTFLNALQPRLQLKTGEISSTHEKGKHTTTFAEMFELEMGGNVIDTPGVKEFGMVNMEQSEISHFFPDIFRVSSGCKFSNCLHVNEPRCAVKAAVESEQIAESRYANYLSILDSIDD